MSFAISICINEKAHLLDALFCVNYAQNVYSNFVGSIKRFTMIEYSCVSMHKMFFHCVMNDKKKGRKNDEKE